MSKIGALSGLLAVSLVLGGCRGCDNKVQTVKPAVKISPATGIDFGVVKIGRVPAGTIDVESLNPTPVILSKVELVGPGVAAFKLAPPPEQISIKDVISIDFQPTDEQVYEAVLRIESNDESAPVTEIPLRGEGAHPKAVVTLGCDGGCLGTITVAPPAIDFGTEPLVRSQPLPFTSLPEVTVQNLGKVDLWLTQLSIEGSDAGAFDIDGNDELPLTDAGIRAEIIPPDSARSFRLRFTPFNKVEDAYSAELQLAFDDPANTEDRVLLTGRRRPNLPPVVCANVVRVTPGDGSGDRLYPWPDAGGAPSGDGGVDFSQSRDISAGCSPSGCAKALVYLSSQSSANPASCTSDPDDFRTGLTYAWSITAQPSGTALWNAQQQPGNAYPRFSDPATPNPVLYLPNVAGEYQLRLTVRDTQGNAGVADVKLLARISEDFVVQLDWSGAPNVDLDLHLVRPSSGAPGDFTGAFSYFSEPGGSGGAPQTSGDINGWARILAEPAASQLNFDWGGAGSFDDPRLNLDVDGRQGELIENISLNYPENDARCDGGTCRYKVFVHYFADRRTHGAPPSCTVNGACAEGSFCGGCTDAGTRCVADYSPQDAGPTTTGACYTPPSPVVRLFFYGDPTPAATIPLPAESLALPVPCQMLYVADVEWPSFQQAAAGLPDGGRVPPTVQVRSTPGAPTYAQFGHRPTTGTRLSCSPNLAINGAQPDWFGPVGP